MEIFFDAKLIVQLTSYYYLRRNRPPMYEEERSQIDTLIHKLGENTQSTDIIDKKKRLEVLYKNQTDPGLYTNVEKMKTINIEIKKLENAIHPWQEIEKKTEDLSALIDMAEEEKDASFQEEIASIHEEVKKEYFRLNLITLFTGESDIANSYLSIHSGAGGTESCDWAMMIFRMYTRWMDRKGFTYTVMEWQPGDEAGIKSTLLHVEGPYAHGYLNSESGVHRLVRISPFDSQKRRHTSFCSVYSTPEIEDAIDIPLRDSDLRIDTFRASGAGGQHVNTTDSAVRITHLPTNVVVTCQAERSQFQNKERAMKILRAKLHDHYCQKQQEEALSNASEKKKIEWGSQIRSYIFQPYTLVKDHRTQYEVGNIQAVMDGEIDELINVALKRS